MKIFSYLRVSGLGQVDKDGPARQRESIAAFCGKHKLHQVSEYFEEGVSGTIDGMERPKFAQMVGMIDSFKGEPALEISAIVVERMDRLARDLMVSEFLLRECRDRGIKVYCADQDALIDLASDDIDPTRTLLRQLMGAFAQWEKSTTVRKLNVSRRRVREGGTKCEGAKLYGFYPKEKRILEHIAIWLENGDSYADIAKQLNKAGDFTRFGKPWTKNNLIKVHQQRNAKYKSEIRPTEIKL